MTQMNPWTPMTDQVSVKILGKLAEELGELTAAVSRCLIQGIAESEPVTGKPNRQWLEEEIADVVAGLTMTMQHFQLDVEKCDSRSLRKMENLAAWHAMKTFESAK
jgi:NTP pyrophosphatase (non-canonical NTP hydrolase)